MLEVYASYAGWVIYVTLSRTHGFFHWRIQLKIPNGKRFPFLVVYMLAVTLLWCFETVLYLLSHFIYCRSSIFRWVLIFAVFAVT